MIALSTRRPIFLSRADRRRMALRRSVMLAAFIISPVALCAGFFFGG